MDGEYEYELINGMISYWMAIITFSLKQITRNQQCVSVNHMMALSLYKILQFWFILLNQMESIKYLM